MWIGASFALAAGLMWGLVFVGPLLLADYPAVMLTFGRYLAFGLIALPLAWLDRAALARLTRADWLEALKLSLVGNIVYYLCLASAIQRAGGPLPTMIIGTLPVVIAIASNWRAGRGGGPAGERPAPLPWLRLAPSLSLIVAGIALVNQVELQRLPVPDAAGAPGGPGAGDSWRYASGAALAVVAVLCWTWYPIRNADWLRLHADRNPRSWATAQGLTTLPLALFGFAATWVVFDLGGAPWAMPFGPRPLPYIGLMLAIGLFSSWLGTLCWNEASQRLPTALVGQLIVFETLSALSYAYLLRGRWPEPGTWAGVALLVGGVLWALRVRPDPVIAEAPPH